MCSIFETWISFYFIMPQIINSPYFLHNSLKYLLTESLRPIGSRDATWNGTAIGLADLLSENWAIAEWRKIGLADL